MRPFIFVRLTAFVLCLFVLCCFVSTAAAQGDGYTLRQKVVIGYIYSACSRYGVDDTGCALPLRVAWRETKYGLNIYSTVDTYNGFSTSVGVFQWYAGPRGDCVFAGAACSGPYYQRYGLRWRENLWLDVDRGVDLLTSAYRGGPNYCGTWLACGGVGGGWPGFPPHYELGD